MRRVAGLCILVFLLLVAVPGASPQSEPPKQDPPASQQTPAAKVAGSSAEKPHQEPDAKLKMHAQPERVSIPGATTLHVVLDTPLSTRIARKGQRVEFLTTEAVWLAEGLELPAETRIVGTVTEARRPGLFGRRGALRVKLNYIELAGSAGADIVARLDGADVNAGRIGSDPSRGADLYTLATWTLSGTLIGSQAGGGKGAAIGAGAGVAAGLILLMARRGPDVYLEPGMPFSVILDDAVEFRAADLPAAGRKLADHEAPAPAKPQPKRPVPDPPPVHPW